MGSLCPSPPPSSLPQVHASTPGGTIVACPHCQSFNKLPHAKSIEIQRANSGGDSPRSESADDSSPPPPAPPAPEKCQECEEDDAACSAWCPSCEQWLCLACDVAIHRKGKRAEHPRVFLQDVFDERKEDELSPSAPPPPPGLAAGARGEDLLQTFRAPDLLKEVAAARRAGEDRGTGQPLPAGASSLADQFREMKFQEDEDVLDRHGTGRPIGFGQHRGSLRTVLKNPPPEALGKPGSQSLPPGFSAGPGPSAPPAPPRLNFPDDVPQVTPKHRGSVSGGQQGVSNNGAYPCFPFSRSRQNSQMKNSSADLSAEAEEALKIRFSCYLCQAALSIPSNTPPGTRIQCTGCGQSIHAVSSVFSLRNFPPGGRSGSCSSVDWFSSQDFHSTGVAPHPLVRSSPAAGRSSREEWIPESQELVTRCTAALITASELCHP